MRGSLASGYRCRYGARRNGVEARVPLRPTCRRTQPLLPLALDWVISPTRKDQTGQIPMKNFSLLHPRHEPSPQAAQDNAPDLLQGEQIFRSLREPRRDSSADARADADANDDDVDTARLPTITSLPEGIEVVEHVIGRAVGQWFLMVRCQCGRRWFEVEAIDTATCPRCNTLVYVDVLDNPRG